MHNKSGQLVPNNILKDISDNYCVTFHAKERISEREDNLDIKNLILNPLIAYYNTDGTINIAKDRFNYLVVSYNSKCKKYIIITYKEMSYNGIDIFEKRNLALKGIPRKN